MTPSRTLIRCVYCGWHCDIPSTYAEPAIRYHRIEFPGHEIQVERYGRWSFGFSHGDNSSLMDRLMDSIHARKPGLIILGIIIGLTSAVLWCQFVISGGP